jgi:hypothetical protein
MRAMRCRSRSSRASGPSQRICYHFVQLRRGAIPFALPMVACVSNGTPTLFVDGAQVTSNFAMMPALTWNWASAGETTASFEDLLSPAIALTISNVVVPNDVCNVAPLLEGSAFSNTFILTIKVAADPATGDPTPGTFGNDAASASFTLTDAQCANLPRTGTNNASNVLVGLQVSGGLVSGSADLRG